MLSPPPLFALSFYLWMYPILIFFEVQLKERLESSYKHLVIYPTELTYEQMLEISV